MERILVTGAASWVGGQCVRALETRADVIAVDELKPRSAFAAPFHLFHLDSLEFARFVVKLEPTIVLHLQTMDRSAELGGTRSREGTVLGAQALFGALARLTQIKQVVVKSDTAVYSTGPRHASVLSEATRITGRATRFERNLREIERFVSEVAAEMPTVGFTVLRLASIFGPTVKNPISRRPRSDTTRGCSFCTRPMPREPSSTPPTRRSRASSTSSEMGRCTSIACFA